jgi:ThiF family/Prokaryotic homologs of the JAB domain
VSLTTTLSLTGDQHRQVREHLFPGDGKEAAVVALCGRRGGSTRCRLLVREVHPVPYDVCTTRAPDAIAWPVAWLDALLERAAHTGLSVVKFHSHPTEYRRFSEADDRSDKRLFEGIHAWIGQGGPHASIVMLPDGSLFGRTITDEGRFAPLQMIAMVGDDLRFWHEQPPQISRQMNGVGRKAAAFGQQMVAELGQLSIAIVGASGTGSPLLEQAGRLGFGRIVTVDPQAAETKNLNRIINARRTDAQAGMSKVAIARRAIEDVDLGSVVETYVADIVSREVIEAVASCDVIFGCVDSAEGRDVLNRISTYYLLPYVDVGVGIVALPDGTIDQINGVIHFIQPGRSSLLSRRAYRPPQVAADALRRKNPDRYEKLRREKYIEGADEEAPAVVSVNMMMASLAMNELLARLYLLRNSPNRHYATVRVSLTEMEIQNETEVGQCQALAKHVGAGDTDPRLGLPELSIDPC